MPHEGYADPITNDGPGFHSDIPVRELTERVTQTIEASDVSSAPPVAETTDGVTHETRPTPRPCLALGSALRRAQPPGRAPCLRWRPTPRSTPLETMAQNIGKSKKSRRQFYPNHPGLGGYTHRVRSRASAGKSKNPPGDF